MDTTAGAPRGRQAHSRWRRRGTVALLGVALGILLLPAAEPGVLNSDWPALATGGHLVTRDPAHVYDRGTQAAEQARITGGAVLQARDEAGLLPFDMPPWVGLMNAPFAALPGSLGPRVWVLLGLLAVLAGVVLMAPAERAMEALPAFASAPTAVAALNAQTDGLVVLGIGAGWALWRGGHRFGAGLALTACLVKPQLVLPLAVAIPLAREWRVFAGWFAGGVGLVAATAAVHARWLVEWPAFLAAHAGRVGTELGPVALVWLTHLPRVAELATAAMLVVLALAVVIWLASRLDRRAGLAVVLAGGLAAAPHVLGSDLVLASAALLVWGRARWYDWVVLSALSLTAALLKGTAGTTLVGVALIALLIARVATGSPAAQPETAAIA